MSKRVRVQASQVVDMIKIALQEDSEDEGEGAGEEDEVKQKTARWPNAKAVGISSPNCACRIVRRRPDEGATA